MVRMLFAYECKLMAAIFREEDKEESYSVYINVYAGCKKIQINYLKTPLRFLVH